MILNKKYLIKKNQILINWIKLKINYENKNHNLHKLKKIKKIIYSKTKSIFSKIIIIQKNIKNKNFSIPLQKKKIKNK